MTLPRFDRALAAFGLCACTSAAPAHGEVHPARQSAPSTPGTMHRTSSPTSSLTPQELADGAFLWPERRQRSDRTLSYPSASQRATLTQWIAATGNATATAGIDLAAAGLQQTHVQVDGHALHIVHEPAPLRYGLGTYVTFCRDGCRPTAPLLLVQAPHEPFDKGTGIIAWSLFRAALARVDNAAFFTNQAHRYEVPLVNPPAGIAAPYDVCHNDDHPFHHASIAAIGSRTQALVVQIHGFAGQNETTHGERPPVDAQAVVSGGTRQPPFTLRDQWAHALQSTTRGKVYRFPEQTNALGATTNVLAKALVTARQDAFVHIELAQTWRQTLERDPAERDRWARALIDYLCQHGAMPCRAAPTP